MKEVEYIIIIILRSLVSHQTGTHFEAAIRREEAHVF